MIYVIDRFFEEDGEDALILKSGDWSMEQMADIVGMLSILYKDKHPGAKVCPLDKIKEVLVKVYGCRDVHHKYVLELPFIRRRLFSKILFVGFELSGNCVSWMDANEAEELCRKKIQYPLIRKYAEDEKMVAIQDVFKEL